jgi:glycosyltransferase involved in cell wall biosynthesis
MSSTLFSNVNIFEGTKAKGRAGEVLIQGNRIKQVSQRRGAIDRNEADEVIDGGGATLMPGLVNPHCHFTYNNATSIADITSPIKMFEYMARHKPIVASDLPVLREILNDSNAVLVGPEDTEAWVAALHTLGDPALRERIGGKAYQDFITRYTWKRRAEKVLEGIAGAR